MSIAITTTTTTMTLPNPTPLGTSNIRGGSRQTRNNPTRTSRNARPTFRQNSLLSNPASVQGAALQEPHGFYPAISHFTDAIAAVPRDFRRHSSLLKEVDAKAWALEDNVTQLLEHCLRERNTRNIASTTHTVPGSTSSVAGDVPAGSAANSVVGQPLDNSAISDNMDQTQRHDLYKTLRANLLQLLMPMDEKNHVINNANDELDKHLRRSDEIWPHVAHEISDDARLGSLKHWALLDLNPVAKAAPVATRGRNGPALLDNDIAERSERRREALLAKKQKTATQLDSDMDDRNATRKKSKKLLDTNADQLALPPLSVVKGKGKKPIVTAERQTTKAFGGGVAMSRDQSLQDNTRKRKAITSAPGAARKRLNLDSKESPKLASSPLAGSFAKDSYKRSPALSAARPAARGRQGSYQNESAANRPSSSASKRATSSMTATNAEIAQVAAATGKTVAEVKNTMKETTNSKGQSLLEEDIPDTVDNRMKGGVLLERTGSKSSQLKREANYSDDNLGRRTASPRLTPSALAENRSEKTGRAKASKTSTPLVGTFAEADASESAANETSAAENGTDAALKLKRPARPRMKDHHGLHDSLSPKGLPTKRTHKKNGSYSLSAQSSAPLRTREDENPVLQKLPTSRNNSRSTKNNSQSDGVNGRNVSTPHIGAVSPLVDEPEALPNIQALDEPVSNRRASTAKGKKDVEKSAADATVRSDLDAGNDADSEADDPTAQLIPARVRPSRKDSSRQLGLLIKAAEPALSQGDDDLEEDDEDDPNEQRYCYCNRVSYGEMVACDNPDCPREWFHLDCVGLKALPNARTTWYCEECKAKFVKA